MSKPLRYDAEADQEIDEAAEYYERQRKGLGVDFLTTLEDAIQDIANYPSSHSVAPHIAEKHKVRRKLLRRFPYAIFYSERPDHIRIIAVSHGHRRPGYWRERLKNT